ncbi:hypothetical protein TI39_contig392g00036 [Zymoseptoria brevis]|uniref:Metallo-beta-lactamase domain-containing protein n=1 Tax=Zymoseptoria brevis TaxID=1047168 RepID=A0A0F4GMY2_9PEZI|nr:hypothetical protein TI39_contig392g00036 [Zymoseptoria brevis]
MTSSLSVHQLNADSTFLLTWTTTGIPSTLTTTTLNALPASTSTSTSVTILVDPWLDGTTTIFHPKFALTTHTSPPAVRSLAELQDTVDMILISQGMEDHCHKETLCSLPPNTTIPIFATPKAARMILSWKHFQNDILQIMKPYNSAKPDTILRLPIHPEVTSQHTLPGELTLTNICPKLDLTGLHNAIGVTYTPPSPTSPSTTPTTLSALYTPHGTPLPSLQPYITSHLAPLPGALPLTALFHSLNNETNPWFMGGEVCAGAPGAALLAREVGVKNWIGAHDEVKDTSGLGTRFIKSTIFAKEEAKRLVEKEECEIWVLGVGEKRMFS